MLTQEYLKSKLVYDEITGVFRKKRNNKKVGKLSSDGYMMVSVDNQYYCAHVLAWLYMHGSLPQRTIDHKNRIRSDNSKDNLRLATFSDNSKNASVSKRNKTACKGVVPVYYGKSLKGYVVNISIDRKSVNLGMYKTLEQAFLIRQAAEMEFQPDFVQESINVDEHFVPIS